MLEMTNQSNVRIGSPVSAQGRRDVLAGGAALDTASQKEPHERQHIVALLLPRGRWRRAGNGPCRDRIRIARSGEQASQRASQYFTARSASILFDAKDPSRASGAS
jgi:hypothetical protein